MNIYLFIPVMGLRNNCSSLTVMSTLSNLDNFFHLSLEMTKCERVRRIHVVQRVKFVINFWCKGKDTLGYVTRNEC